MLWGELEWRVEMGLPFFVTELAFRNFLNQIIISSLDSALRKNVSHLGSG